MWVIDVKKVIYVICVCLLSIIIIGEFRKQNCPDDEKKDNAVPTIQNGVGEQEKKVAYLSFDDGPSEITPEILETLKKKDVKATFFLIGNEITKERECILKQELKEGHCIGVHTYSHKKSEMYCDEKFFFEDFNQCSDRIKEVTGVAPKVHRFPWGSNNGYVCPIVDDLLAKLKKQDVTSYDWNVSGEDSVGGTVAKATIYRNVTKDLEKQNQPIILLHDSATMKNTAAVLGEIIDYIKDKGYSFDTLNNREQYTFPESWRK